jgi:hypothetical protein
LGHGIGVEALKGSMHIDIDLRVPLSHEPSVDICVAGLEVAKETPVAIASVLAPIAHEHHLGAQREPLA